MKDQYLHKTLEEAVFTFIDVETTGLSPSSARVCEIALISFSGGRRVGDFSSLVNPRMRIPPEVSRIHGITDEMVRHSPEFGMIAPRIIGAVQDSVIVAHNADFDLGFLRMEFALSGLRFPDLPVIDTLCMARNLGNFTNNRLGTVAKELNISSENWHRAFSDVEMTRKIFEHFISALKKDGAATIGDVLKKLNGVKQSL